MEIGLELLLNIPTLRVTNCSISDKEAHLHCESILSSGCCPVCLQSTSKVTMYQTRTIRDMALLGRKVFLHLAVRQFHCLHCDRYVNERFDFVEPSKTMTKRYEAYIYSFTQNSCISQVGIREDITWASVQEIQVRYGKKQLSTRAVWQHVRYLGIDEIAVRKGKKNYACCLVDIERGIILDFLESRQKADVVAYFQAKGAGFCQQIEVVSSDMWEGYTTLAGTVFPRAITVVDRYHFFAHFNQALHATRSMLRKEFPDEETFKQLRWALLKSPEQLSQQEQAQLEKAFCLSEELAQIYQLRKDLKQIFDTHQPVEEAEKALDAWQEKAGKVESKPLKSFLKIVVKWKTKVLNFFHDRITNGVVEGLNNAIRGIIRRSFGFRHFENLRRRVLVELG